MERKNNKKRNRIMLLLILLLAISVGYALLSTTLKINGTTTIAKQGWNVYWSNVQVNQQSVNPSTNPPTIGQDTNDPVNTKVTWSTTLTLPGDFYEFTVDATNAGTVDAMITDIDETLPSSMPDCVNYSVTYSDGLPIRKYHKLAKQTGNSPTTETYKIRVEIDPEADADDLDEIPAGGLQLSFEYDVTYSQANQYAYDRTYSDLEFSDHPGITGGPVVIGDTLAVGESTPDYTTLLDGNNNQREIFVGYKLDNNRTVLKGYACGIYKNELFCIEGPGNESTYDIATTVLPTIFGEYDSNTGNGCKTNSGYVCFVDGNAQPITYIATNANAYVKNASGQSQVYPMGQTAPGGIILTYYNN